MNVKDIIRGFLQTCGYDGLFNADRFCACELPDLFPCIDEGVDCEPGFKVPCPGPGDPDEYNQCDGDCGFHIVAEKPKETK